MLDPRIKKPVSLTFPAGINTRARETALPDGAARDAMNVDFTREGGVIFPAGGYSAVSGAPGGHSLWAWPGLGYALYVTADGTLARVGADGGIAALAAVSPHQPMAYAAFNGRAYFANGSEMGYVEGEAAHPWGIDPPPPPLITLGADGGLPAGRYLLAITVIYNDGEESAPCAPQPVALKSVGGIRLALPFAPSISAIRVYCSSTTAANGEELFYHGAALPGSGYLVAAAPAGPRLNSLFMGRMPCGGPIAAFKRRLLVAVGATLYFSEIEQASLCDRTHGWLPFGDPITCIAPVDDGCYIGTTKNTYWCAGTDPADWTRAVQRACGIALQRSVPWLPGDAFPSDTAPPGAAVPWFSQDGGLCVGRNGGVIQSITHAAVGMASYREATLFYRECGGLRQMIASLRGKGHDARSTPTSPVASIQRYGLAT